MSDSNSADRDAEIRNLVKECLRKWSEGVAGYELDLVDAHPELAPDLGLALRKARMVAMAANRDSESIGRNSGLRIRCPHCSIHLELVEPTGESISCQSCGEEFSMVEDDADSNALRMLGTFRLEERIGVGSFGSVWRAFDEELQRDVAVKIPRRSQLSSVGQGPFLREAQVSAQLNHPNIVSVHEVGRDDSTFFIVSDFVEGQTLAQHLSHRGNYRAKEAAKLCETLARAVHHAHERGVIHRDLKPANVMIGENNVAQIMDFGLAKREAAEITMTTDGQVLGTPAYMSPEQASGESHRVDGRSDVYSLGVILFELLTGQLPFRGSVRMLIQQVISDDPPSPRKLTANVPRDLETICLKCLAKEPSGRYASAEALADDLYRFVDGIPIRARPISRPSRAIRWAGRYPIAALLLGLVTVVSIAGPLVAWHERHQRNRIEGLNEENLTIISRLKASKEDVDERLTHVSRKLAELGDRLPTDDEIARALMDMHPQKDEPKSVQAIITKAILLAQMGEPSIDLFQQAIKTLDQVEGTDAQLALADCLIRLSKAQRRNNRDASLQSVKRAVVLLQQVESSNSSVLSRTLHRRALRLLATASGDAGDHEASLAAVLKAKAKFEIEEDEVMTATELYEITHGLFTRVPPLLDD